VWEQLETLTVAIRHLKQPSTQRLLEGTEPMKGFIARVKESFLLQNESRQVVLWFGAGHPACLSQEVDGGGLDSLKERFAVIFKSMRCCRHELRHGCMQFIEIHPHSLKKELGPDQQDTIGDEPA